MNPISGTVSKARIPWLIDEYLDKRKYDFAIAKTEYPGHAAELAREAAANGVDIVVAVGGDGTVNEVGRGLVNTSTAMAILPCGSGNGLARHLLLPMDLRRCIDILNVADIHPLDYGVINGHPFFCTCGMGFDAFISMKFAEAGKRGPLTYVEKVLQDGLTYKPETYTIEDDQGKSVHKAFLVTCANASQYGNNAWIAPHASMSDGMLDVIIMEPFDLIDAPQVTLELFNKTIDRSKKIKLFKASHIHIHREQPGVIHFDGDPTMTDADVDVRVVSKGINIVVNPFANKNDRNPNAVQTAFSEMFYNIDVIRERIAQQGRRFAALNKVIQRKLGI